MNTYTGKRFKISELRAEDICLTDIAHSLSMICRFNGHCSFFYSVAQHCLSIAGELKNFGYPAKIQLYGLLHDAAEAYVCDLPKPVKTFIPQYKRLENIIQDKIWEAFNIPKPSYREYKIIKTFDDLMMMLETKKLMTKINIRKPSIIKLKTEISYVPPDNVEQEFIITIKNLLNQIKQ